MAQKLIEKSIKIGSKIESKCGAISNTTFKGFLWILGVILAPKMEPKSKKNGIENKSDFQMMLYGGIRVIGPRNVALDPPWRTPICAPGESKKQ